MSTSAGVFHRIIKRFIRKRDFLSSVGLGSMVSKVHVLPQLVSKGWEQRHGAKTPAFSFPGCTACSLELTEDWVKWQEMNIWRSFPARGKELSIARLGQHGSRPCVSCPENLRVYAVLREELGPPTPPIVALPISLSCLPLSEWRAVLVFSVYKIERLNTYLAQHPGFSKCSKPFFPLPSRNQDNIKHSWILCRPKWQKKTTPGFFPVVSVDPLAT